jgi:hypothetical protein
MSTLPELDLRKALDTGAVSTGAVLVPEIVSPGIRMFVETRSPLWNILPKIDHDGYSYNYKEQNGLPVGSFGAELAALPAAQNATYVDRTVPIKSLYIRGEISGQLIEASRTFVNALEREITNSALGMVRTIEQALIAGDSGVSSVQFDGLAKWITNTVYADSVGDGSGTDGELSLAFLDLLLDAPAGGEPTHLIMGKAMTRKLWSILQPQVRYLETEIDGGFRVPTYMGLPIVRLFDHVTLLNNTILAFDRNLVTVPILKPITYEELAHTRDSTDYMLKTYMTLVVEGASRHHAKLVDVDSTIA